MTSYGPGAPPDPHMDVGAYVLGVLDEDGMARFEQHLAYCERCGQQLDELSGLVPVLAEIGRAGVPERPKGDAMLDRLLVEVSAQHRTQRRRRLVAVAAAAVLVAGGPTAAVLAMEGGGGIAAPPAIAGALHTGTNPATGAQATVGTVAKSWGSQIDMRLTGVKGPLTCSLVAVAKDGSRQTVATWSVPVTGYRPAAERNEGVTLHGSAGISPTDIARFDVVTSDGNELVTVPL